MNNHDTTTLHALLSQEKCAREELVKLIDELLGCKVPQDLFAEVTEQTLLTIKEYLVANRELTNLIRLQILPPATVGNDTIPPTERNPRNK